MRRTLFALTLVVLWLAGAREQDEEDHGVPDTASPATPLTGLAGPVPMQDEHNSGSVFTAGHAYAIAGIGRQVGLQAGAQPGAAADATGSTTLVSVSSAGAQATGASGLSAISADGRYVAFESLASNLAPGDLNSGSDIFIRDLVSDSTQRVTGGGSGVYGISFGLDISADGRFIAFESASSGIAPGDGHPGPDVFVYDHQSGTTEVVSVDSGGNPAQPDGCISDHPAISSDGKFVAFSSSCSNLSPLGPFGIFVHDRQTGSTEKIPGSGQAGYSVESGADLSGDGNLVVFEFGSAIKVYDRQATTTELVSVDSLGNPANAASARAAISANGRFVSFDSLATNLVPGDTNGRRDIFVRDRQAGTTSRVNVDSSGNQGLVGFGDYGPAPLSADGRFIAFDSDAQNLVSGDTNWCGALYYGYGYPCIDVFVRDLQTGITERISVDSLGQQGNLGADTPSISGDGRVVTFSSSATNLVSGDTNNFCQYDYYTPEYENCADIFTHEFGDTDADGSWDPFDPCPTVANENPSDSDGDLKPDACDGAGSGNVDCSLGPAGTSAVDALKVLRYVAALAVVQDEPCLDIGQLRLLDPPANRKMGDVDCSGVANAVDALKILRAVAGLSVAKPVLCPEIIIVLPP